MELHQCCLYWFNFLLEPDTHLLSITLNSFHPEYLETWVFKFSPSFVCFWIRDFKQQIWTLKYFCTWPSLQSCFSLVVSLFVSGIELLRWAFGPKCCQKKKKTKRMSTSMLTCLVFKPFQITPMISDINDYCQFWSCTPHVSQIS